MCVSLSLSKPSSTRYPLTPLSLFAPIMTVPLNKQFAVLAVCLFTADSIDNSAAEETAGTRGYHARETDIEAGKARQDNGGFVCSVQVQVQCCLRPQRP